MNDKIEENVLLKDDNIESLNYIACLSVMSNNSKPKVVIDVYGGMIVEAFKAYNCTFTTASQLTTDILKELDSLLMESKDCLVIINGAEGIPNVILSNIGKLTVKYNTNILITQLLESEAINSNSKTELILNSFNIKTSIRLTPEV